MLGKGSTAVMGMWLKRYRYAAGEKKEGNLLSNWLGNLPKAVPEAQTVEVF